MKKLTRKRCSYGWTDHAFRRLQNKGYNRKFKPMRKRKFVSVLNEVLHHKEKYGIPF